MNLWGRLRAACASPVVYVLLIAAALFLLRGGAGSLPAAASLEARAGAALSGIDGAGSVEVVVRTQKIDDQEVPCGALAIAQGADDPIVRLEMTQALCALLGLQASSVEVIGVSGGTK